MAAGKGAGSGARRMGRGSTLRIAVGALVIAGLGFGAVILATGGSSGSGEGVRAGDFARAEAISFDISVTASGELVAKNQIEIKSPLDTRSQIAELVDEGTIVQQGDLLIRLNTDEIEQQIRQERLSVIQARNDLDQAEASVRLQLNENASARQDAELKVELAQLALERWREGEVAKRREQLRIAAESAERELSRLKEKVERTRMLYENEFKSKDELEQVEIQYQRAIADDVIANLDIEIYEGFQHPEDEKTKVADVEKAKAALGRTLEQNEINLKNKQATVETRREQLKLREERLAELEEQFESATMLAPRSGLVVYASSLRENFRGGGDPLDVGMEVYPNQLLLVLPDTSEMVASVSVHESLAGRLRPGQRAQVRVEAVDQTFTGVVMSIGVLAETGGWRDPNRREYNVRVALDGGQAIENLKPSMRCDATITLDRASDVIAVPVEAIFSDGPVQFVYVPTGKGVVRRPIRMGKRSDLYAEISKGLSAGESVRLREPKAGEASPMPWDKDELLAAGYRLDENGNPVAPFDPSVLAAPQETPRRPAGGPGGGPSGSREGRPGGNRPNQRPAQRSGG